MIRTLSLALTGLAALLCAGCSDDTEVKGQEAFERYVANSQVGRSPDQWIEMKSVMTGDWDRVGLIFGYEDDLTECRKAIAGLKQENYAREYRCAPSLNSAVK